MNYFNQLLLENDRIIEYLKTRYLDGILQYKGKIQNVLDILSDDESKRTYINDILYLILVNFLKGDLPSFLSGGMSNSEVANVCKDAKQLELFNTLCVPEGSTITEWCLATTFILKQYQYKNLVKIEKDDVCLDIGACYGDTSIWFINNGAKCSYAFEISHDNLNCLKENFKNYTDRCIIAPLACADQASEIFYIPRQGNYGAGRIVKNEPKDLHSSQYYKVQCTTIDEFCDANNLIPNFIKMDIEGAEPFAIKGASNTLQTYRPKFAICIYHTWPHRWEIPLMLNDLLPDYDFYLKKSHPVYETVLFGKPKK